MFCEIFGCSILTDDCIRRQLTPKEEIPKEFKNSFRYCREFCKKGKKVLKNPEKFINKDVYLLKKQQEKEMIKRGWIIKETKTVLLNEHLLGGCFLYVRQDWEKFDLKVEL